MGRLTREDLLKRGGPRQKTLHVEEWDADITIRELTLNEQGLISDAARDPVGAAAKVLLAGLVDPQLQAEDLANLREMGNAALNRVAVAILDLSGLTPASQAALQAK